MTVSPGRRVAFDVLTGVATGGYASDLLREQSTGLDSRDAGLASELALGVLRHQSALDWLIAHYSGSDRKLDAEVRNALRLGIYQLRYLDRIPRHAAVSESVEIVKRSRRRSGAGLVNAVLRKVTRDVVQWPSRVVELSTPDWLLARWDAQYGEAAATALARANLTPPEAYFRGGTQMDIGSQTIAPLVDLKPEHRFLDLCAAPGNKTAHALEYRPRLIVACDRHLHRLHMIQRLRVPLVQLDATEPLPFPRIFDRILVDAPCSGTGTLARNPEIKWKLTEADIADLATRQRAILSSALGCLAPGGKLVYSTCSMEREENEAIIDGFNVTTTQVRLPGRDPGDGFFAAVIEG